MALARRTTIVQLTLMRHLSLIVYPRTPTFTHVRSRMERIVHTSSLMQLPGRDPTHGYIMEIVQRKHRACRTSSIYRKASDSAYCCKLS
jgi:hypothetical protein